MSKADEILETALQEAKQIPSVNPSAIQAQWVQTIVVEAEKQKAVLAVVITSLVKKIDDPQQDIRKHKTEMPGGYSGRSFDTNHVTPFIAKHFRRLAMQSGSGWLTRSLEQNHPFTKDFPGKIQNIPVKEAFLNILDDIEANEQDPKLYLVCFLQNLLAATQTHPSTTLSRINLTEVSVAMCIHLLESHFFHPYPNSPGASRLPVLALYAIYEIMIFNNPRYQQKQLLPLKRHTTSDIKSRSLGDIEITEIDGIFFEVLEVKHGISISSELIEGAYDKFRKYSIQRYYLLTTAEPNSTNPEGVSKVVEKIRQEHGCEVIVNGVLPTLKYYLRLVPSVNVFLQGYTSLLKKDFDSGTDIKLAHLQYWQELLQQSGLTESQEEKT
jgi:DNA (cytosine-5)-methyltransferase 1